MQKRSRGLQDLRSTRFAFFLVTFVIAGCGFACSQAIDDGLIGHWKFDEGAGDVIRDSSSNRNDGLIIPPAARTPKWGAAEFAGAASFSGKNDHYIRVPASASLNTIKKQITVAALIYPRSLWSPIDRYLSFAQRKWKEAVQFTRGLLGAVPETDSAVTAPSGFIAIVQRQWRETIHPDQFYLGYGRQNNVLHYKWHLGLTGDDDVSIYSLPKGQLKPRIAEWVHLAGTYDGETGKMALYVDGELIGTLMHPGAIRLDQESLDRPLAIGGELNGPSTVDPTADFDGYIGDVRIYNRALSDEEIKFLASKAKR